MLRQALGKGERMRTEHPCRKDCPKRTAECKRDCPDWAKYAAAKKTEYEARVVQSMIDDAMYNAERKRTKRGCFLGSETRPRHTGD